MTFANRLSRLTPALSGKERALAVIRTFLDGRESDPDLRRMPSDQHREYEYFIALFFVSDTTLGTLLQALTWNVDSAEIDQQQYRFLAAGAGELEEVLEELPDPDFVKHGKGDAEINMPTYLRRLERIITMRGLERLLTIWKELRAIEIIWSEIADECDGDDLCNPDLKAKAVALGSRLLVLIEALSPKHARKPPEPDQSVLDMIWSHVDTGLRIAGLKDPQEYTTDGA